MWRGVWYFDRHVANRLHHVRPLHVWTVLNGSFLRGAAYLGPLLLNANWNALWHFMDSSWVGAAWWAKALGIVIGTFILEDATTILAAMAADQGKLSPALALVSLYVGVAAGDVLLYGMGALGARWVPLQRWLTLPKRDRGHAWFSKHVVRTVVISRFIPGARLPLYTACGYFRAPLGRFALSAICATLVWTSLLFGISMHVGGWMSAHLSSWRWLGMLGFVFTLFFVGRLVARLQTFSD